MEAILITVLVGIIFISGCAQQTQQQSNTEQISGTANLDAFAQCLSGKGVKVYGSYTCSACKAQIKSFGTSWKYINYVECHPQGPNPQPELCLEKNIRKTPTWILEKNGVELKRLEGYQLQEDLTAFSGCSLG